jgi:transposase InsO family protein
LPWKPTKRYFRSLQDGTKAYIQLVLDNFSRRIIAYEVEPSPSALLSEQLLRSAFASIADTAPDHSDLIVDSGSGNNNQDRPHYALKGLTPNQAYSGMTFNEESYRRRLAEARAERIRVNRLPCNSCRPLDLSIGESKEEENEGK